MTRTKIKRLDRDLTGRGLGPETSCRPARVMVIMSRRKESSRGGEGSWSRESEKVEDGNKEGPGRQGLQREGKVEGAVCGKKRRRDMGDGSLRPAGQQE